MTSSGRAWKTSSIKRLVNTSWRHLEDVLEDKKRCAEDVFNTSSLRQMFAGLALGSQAALVIFHWLYVLTINCLEDFWLFIDLIYSMSWSLDLSGNLLDLMPFLWDPWFTILKLTILYTLGRKSMYSKVWQVGSKNSYYSSKENMEKDVRS